MIFENFFKRSVAANRFSRPFRPIADAVLGRSFPSNAQKRLLICYHPNEICWSLVYPYFHYAGDFMSEHGMAIRTMPVGSFLNGGPLPKADVVVIQPWFTEPPEGVEQAILRYRDQNPAARMIFLDSFAPTDLRLGRAVFPHVHLYQRKAVFKEKTLFLKGFAGDTNLTEYYSHLYGLPAQPTDWQVPEGLLNRLSLVPGFLTAPYVMKGLSEGPPNPENRPIDLHSRIASKGTGWYEAMRKHAEDAARSLDHVRLTPSGRIPKSAFLTELRQSKLCWSPFGYGELCWRDLEAFMTGAVLVKPNMGHLLTMPDLYRPGETYLSVKWDFSDLEEVVRGALADGDLRRHLAANAFNACLNYIKSKSFVRDMAGDLLQ